MKKWIFNGVCVHDIYGRCSFDGLDNQDMTEPTIHFGKKSYEI